MLAAGPASSVAQGILKSAGVALPPVPEALALAQGRASGKQILLASGRDARGLVYALTELTDRVQLLAEPLAAQITDIWITATAALFRRIPLCLKRRCGASRKRAASP